MLRLFIFNAPNKNRVINAYAVTSESGLKTAWAKVESDKSLDIDGQLSFVVTMPVLSEIEGVMLLTPEPERTAPITQKTADEQADRINGE